jgi:hypothetical protein
MGYSGAGEKPIHEKNQKQKISGHCPFKRSVSDSLPEMLLIHADPDSQHCLKPWWDYDLDT